MSKSMENQADIIVIGAGIAGASVAANLAQHGSVILLEKEAQPGHHATGRSAAYYAPSYGNEVVQAISKASGAFFFDPPEGFSTAPLIRPRDAWFIGTHQQQKALNELQTQNPELEKLTSQTVCEHVPILRSDYVDAAMADPGGGDLDVDAILQGYLKAFKQLGGVIETNCSVASIEFQNGKWYLSSKDKQYTSAVVVNAAGAWADEIAQLAGLQPLGIAPLRRTACLIDLPSNLDANDWPLIIDADEQFYFKPDAGLLLISPANESPSPACDAQPDDLDVAQAVDRVMHATTLDIKRIAHKWAGLRSFASDRTFVAGFDPRAKGFFWLAGQGGYGVQSAPGLSHLAAHLLTGNTLAAHYDQLAGVIELISPERFLNE